VFSETFKFKTFSCETRVVNIERRAFNDSQVSWHAHTLLEINDVTYADFPREDLDLFARAYDFRLGRHLVLEGGHGLVGLKLLLESEKASQKHNH